MSIRRTIKKRELFLEQNLEGGGCANQMPWGTKWVHPSHLSERKVFLEGKTTLSGTALQTPWLWSWRAKKYYMNCQQRFEGISSLDSNYVGICRLIFASVDCSYWWNQDCIRSKWDKGLFVIFLLKKIETSLYSSTYTKQTELLPLRTYNLYFRITHITILIVGFHFALLSLSSVYRKWKVYVLKSPGITDQWTFYWTAGRTLIQEGTI